MAAGGIGDAMLLGAAMGGGASAITGGNPLKGALLGGITGGIVSGIGSLIPSAGGGTGSLVSAAPAVQGPPVSLASDQVIAANAANAVPSATTTLPALQGPPMIGASDQAIAANAGNMGNVGMPSAATAATPQATSMTPGLFEDPTAYLKAHPWLAGASGLAGAVGGRNALPTIPGYEGSLGRFKYDPSKWRRSWATGGPVEGIPSLAAGGGYDRTVGENPFPMPVQQMASGGISDLGGYSDGGRMLEGPGDGMSDSIPASIGAKQPARLADGEFVVPADVVSHMGNGSTDAGARQLYSMMDRVRKARTGTKRQGRQINPQKFMPA